MTDESIYAPTVYNAQSTKHDITAADFKLFIVIWNQRMNMKTPMIHLKMAEWLEWNWQKKNTRQLLMAFRSAGKSTIVGLFAAWLLYRDPCLRILVLAADHTLATKMVRNVKRILERHPLTPKLKPERADQWASDRFTVKRLIEMRDPSMIAHGISMNITGSRADIIICDDVEVPNTCDGAEKRMGLRERLGEMSYVLAPGGTQLYVGTPHTYYTIYADEPRTEIGEIAPFLGEFKRLKIPILNEQGESAWIERYGDDDIARMKREAGPNRFKSQMMLEPVNIAQGRLDPASLNFYDGSLAYLKELSRLEIQNRQMVSCSAWWDPAFGHGGDSSVLAVVFTDTEGLYWLHRVEYIAVDSCSGDDEATQQCQKVAFIAQLLRVPAISVEINGIGKFLPAILRRELAKKRVPCAVKEISSRRPKDVRILEAFDAILAARALSVHDSVKKTPFIAEMQEWAPGGKGRDDGLDAVAGALSQEPVRIERAYRKGQHDWMRGVKAHKAGTDFRV